MSDRMLDTLQRRWNVSSRREFFHARRSGLAGIALSAILAEDGYAAGCRSARAQAAPSAAQSQETSSGVSWKGGPSQVDLFDPKPMLEKYALQPMPASFTSGDACSPRMASKPSDGMFPSRRAFKQYGQSGLVGLRLVART